MITRMDKYVEILFNGQQFKKLFERKYYQISKKYGLTKIEIEILLFLEKNQVYNTAKDIVELKYYAKSHVSKAIDSLIHKGYVLGNLDEQDRRCVHLKIADAAKLIVSEANEMRDNLINILFKDITLEERRMMECVAKKITNNIKEAMEKDE